MRPFVPKGWSGRLLIVGEAPGEDEDERSHRPFTGRAGRLLRELWHCAGYEDVDIALVNAVRCRPRGNATPRMVQVRACRPFLLRVLEVLRPRGVLGVGATAARALLDDGSVNVTVLRGRRIEVPGLELRPPEGCYVTYHPAAVLRGAPHLRSRIVEDLARFGRGELPHPDEAIPSSPRVLGLDTEFAKAKARAEDSPSPSPPRLLTIGVADGRRAWAVDFPSAEDPEAGRQILADLLSRAEWLAGANIVVDVDQLVVGGYPVREEWVTGEALLDSVLLARMADENDESYALEDQLLSRYRTEPWKAETEKFNYTIVEGPDGRKRRVRDVDATRWPAELRKKRCRLDAWAGWVNALDAWRRVVGQAADRGRVRRLIEFTHRVAATLHRVELAGMTVDLNRFEALGKELEGEMLAARDQLDKIAVAAGMTEAFSPSNDGHIRTLLYERLGLPVLGRTETTGLPSVSKDVLRLPGLVDHPAVQALLRYNAAEKLFSTNIEGLREYLRPMPCLSTPDGGIVPLALLPIHLNPLGARTGRRSSSSPNVQNWAKRIRRIVRSRFPDGKIGAFDYEKLEPRILGWVAREPFLLDVFGPKGGGYITIAQRLWRTEVAAGSPEYKATKSIVLGVHYNMQGPKMAKQLWLMGVRFSADFREHTRITERLRRRYLSLIPRVVDYMARQEEALLRNGQVVTPTGRVRHLPCPEGRDTPGFGHLLNQAINLPIQSLAADITGSALVDIERELLGLHGLGYRQYLELLLGGLTEEPGCGIIGKMAEERHLYPMSLLINEVHDEVTLDLHPRFLKRDVELVIETMRAVPTFRRLVPEFDSSLLTVSPHVSTYWHGDENSSTTEGATATT